MLRLSLIFSFLMAFSLCGFAQYEKEAIEELMREAYINGSFNQGIPRNIELGFSTDFREVVLLENGRTLSRNYHDWLAEVQQKMADEHLPATKENAVSLRYLKFDIVGDIALLKLHFIQGGKTQHTEFVSLFHFPEGWKVVSRTYQQKAQPE